MELHTDDVAITRELAGALKEIAQLPIQEERKQLWRDINSLKRCRIPVKYHVEELCWLEVLPDSVLTCRDETARHYEKKLRRLLWQAENLNDDWVYVDIIESPHCILPAQLKNATRHSTGREGDSYVTEPILEIGDDPLRLVQKEHSSVDLKLRDEHQRFARELVGETLSVVVEEVPKLGGAPFDYVCELMGQEQAFLAMITDPVWFKELMAFVYGFYRSRSLEHEEMGLLTLNNSYQECYNGGISYCDELPVSSEDVKLKDLWGFTTAQAAVSISPHMHEEFVSAFDREYLDLFGLNAIACCETVDHKMDLYRSIPNLRRISISEFNDLGLAAELLGDEYIYSFKPTGTYVGFEKWDEDADRKYLDDALEKSRGCHVEIINNTISTCRGEKDRVIRWCNLAMEAAHKFS